MKTVIEMAREAGLFTHKEVQPELERFAELVRADERERLAKIQFESILQAIKIEREACAVIAETPISGEQDDITMQAKDRVATAIRARGETE
jgi:hypothetical protein